MILLEYFYFVFAVTAALSPMAACFSMNPAHHYFDMMNQQEDDHISINHQSPTVDAKIIGKTVSNKETYTVPPLPDTNNPFILLGLNVAASFDAVKRAYKERVKVYHPDKLIGPDASPEERKRANWDFARINSAYDILKRRENEDRFEYEMFVDGAKVTRSVSMDKDQGRYRRDAHHIDYDRIRQVAEYRRTHPKKKMWYEEEHDYQPINNGFQKDVSYCSNEKWYNHLEMFEYEQEVINFPPYNGYDSTCEPIGRNDDIGHHYVRDRQVEEKFWHNRHTFTTNNYREDRWWQEDKSRNFGKERTFYSVYNDMVNQEMIEQEFRAKNFVDYEFEEYDPTNVWYKHLDDEPKFNGNFGP